MGTQDVNKSRVRSRLRKLTTPSDPARIINDAEAQMAAIQTNPFLEVATDKPLVAVPGKRNGYLMLAPRQEITRYAELPDGLLKAARAWAARLEQLGALRVYWITLSELNPHLHIHLYPRWTHEDLKGTALFESREFDPQPEWTETVREALLTWAAEHQVGL